MVPFCGFAQNSTTAGLAGVGAGAALGAGGATGAGSTSASSLGAGSGGASGGGSAPIEIQIMAYHGLQKIAADIANVSANRICAGSTVTQTIKSSKRQKQKQAEGNSGQSKDEDAQTKYSRIACSSAQPILVEDSTSSNQIAIYQALKGYRRHVDLLAADLRFRFALQLPASLELAAHSVEISLTNTSAARLTDLHFRPGNGSNQQYFSLDSDGCSAIPKYTSCRITVSVDTPKNVKSSTTLTGTFQVAYSGDIKTDLGIVEVNSTRTLEVKATFKPKPAAKPAAKPEANSETAPPAEVHPYEAQIVAPAGAALAAPAAGASPAAAGASTTPLSLTYLSGISQALGALKSGIAYSPSAFQPTTQTFQVLLENELQLRKLVPYTSTSALSLAGATDDLAEMFGGIISAGNDVDKWAKDCQPPSQTATPNKNVAVPSQQSPNDAAAKTTNPVCNDPLVVSNIAAAQQMITGYTTLFQAPSDSNGNAVIVDALRGSILSKKLESGMKSIQVTVAAAGGSTRTNAFFLENIFYLPKPSFNSGVLVTFEIRDNNNDLLQSGARTAFYDYNKKWKGTKWKKANIQNADDCGDDDTYCAEDKQ